MPYSSPSRILSTVCLRVRRIRGGDWSSFDAGGHPIVFERRKLNESERLYSSYEKEMLAIMHALTKFRQYLVGSRFVVKIDHNSLKYFLDEKDLSERQQKWVSKIQAFDFDIEYVKGKMNVVADTLSRRPTGNSMMDICIH
jgi:hypothetical protein